MTLTDLEPGQAGADLDRHTEAYQHCLIGIRKYWAKDLYKQVLKEARQSHSPAEIAGSSADQLEREMLGHTTYQYFAWLEHQLQQFKYLGRYGIVTEMAARGPQLAELLDSAAQRSPERLHLNPDIVFPTYYTRGDFHQHPGGIWSDDYDAFAYEMTARLTGAIYAQSGSSGYATLARLCQSRYQPKKVLDVGCGFGWSTLPFKSETDATEVVGCDLSAPALKLAHLRALEAGLDIDFYQERAEELAAFPDDSFDLVNACLLLHEIPQKVIRQFLVSARRVLRPGGKIVLNDIYRQPGGPLAEMFYLGISSRNREPFMRSLIALDMEKELADAGFTEGCVESFEAAVGKPAPQSISEDFHSNRWALITGTA